MKSSIKATIEIARRGQTEFVDADIIFSLANAALLKVVAQRALALDGIRINAAAESISACNAAFGAILYVAGVPSAMAVHKVRIYCSSGLTCPNVTFEGKGMAIKPQLTIEMMRELASAEPPELPMLDTEVACKSCAAVEMVQFRDLETGCHYCGQKHAEAEAQAA